MTRNPVAPTVIHRLLAPPPLAPLATAALTSEVKTERLEEDWQQRNRDYAIIIEQQADADAFHTFSAATTTDFLLGSGKTSSSRRFTLFASRAPSYDH